MRLFGRSSLIFGELTFGLDVNNPLKFKSGFSD